MAASGREGNTPPAAPMLPVFWRARCGRAGSKSFSSRFHRDNRELEILAVHVLVVLGYRIHGVGNVRRHGEDGPERHSDADTGYSALFALVGDDAAAHLALHPLRGALREPGLHPEP